MKSKVTYGTEIINKDKPKSPYDDLILNCCPNCGEIDTENTTVIPIIGEKVTKYKSIFLGFAYDQYDILPHICKSCNSIIIQYKKHRHVNMFKTVGRCAMVLGASLFYTLLKYGLGRLKGLFIIPVGFLAIAMFVGGFVYTLISDYCGFDGDVSQIYTNGDYERLTLTPLNANDSCEVPYVIDKDIPLPYYADE